MSPFLLSALDAVYVATNGGGTPEHCVLQVHSSENSGGGSIMSTLRYKDIHRAIT